MRAAAAAAALVLAASRRAAAPAGRGRTGEATLTVYVSAPLSGPGRAEGQAVADGARRALADAGGEAGGFDGQSPSTSTSAGPERDALRPGHAPPPTRGRRPRTRPRSPTSASSTRAPAAPRCRSPTRPGSSRSRRQRRQRPGAPTRAHDDGARPRSRGRARGRSRSSSRPTRPVSGRRRATGRSRLRGDGLGARGDRPRVRPARPRRRSSTPSSTAPSATRARHLPIDEGDHRSTRAEHEAQLRARVHASHGLLPSRSRERRLELGRSRNSKPRSSARRRDDRAGSARIASVSSSPRIATRREAWDGRDRGAAQHPAERLRELAVRDRVGRARR